MKIEIEKTTLRQRSDYSRRTLTWTVWTLSVDGVRIAGDCDTYFTTRRAAVTRAAQIAA